MKHLRFIIIFLVLTLLAVSVNAQKSSDNKNIWLAGIISRLENNIKNSSGDYKRYDEGISKCDKTIAKSENIISLAQEKNNLEAEKIAKEASSKAEMARIKYLRLREAARRREIQSQANLYSIKRTIKEYSSQTPSVNAVAMNYSGHITIQKANGEQFVLDESRSAFLETGDVISTSEDSKVELEFLEGRGNVVVGENSKLKMEREDDNADVMNILQGKMKIEVLKINDYEQKMQKEYEENKQNPGFISEAYEQMLGALRAKVQKKFKVRTPSFAMAIRGTEFIVNSVKGSGSELIVIEGTVEAQSLKDSGTILVNANQKAVINNDGALSGPLEIDISKLAKWWEDEK
jgi:hypothetical protein